MELATRTYNFRITGLTPLLMHADDVELSDSLEAWRKDPANKNVSKAGDDRSPPWTWQTYCYTDGQYVTIPSDNVMAALRYAGSQLIMKKTKSFKSATQCGLLMSAMHYPILLDGDRKILKEEIEAIEGVFSEHVHAVRNLGFALHVKRIPVGKSKHVRVRPRFDTWALEGQFEVTLQEITDDVLVSMWDIAGNYAGLCDWRPSSPRCPGPFGRFSVELTKAKKPRE